MSHLLGFFPNFFPWKHKTGKLRSLFGEKIEKKQKVVIKSYYTLFLFWGVLFTSLG